MFRLLLRALGKLTNFLQICWDWSGHGFERPGDHWFVRTHRQGARVKESDIVREFGTLKCHETSWNVMLSVSTAMIKPFPWNVYSSQDSGGSIDEKEFVKTLYPDEYRMLHLCYKVYILVNTHLEHHLENAPTTFNLGRCSKCHT